MRSRSVLVVAVVMCVGGGKGGVAMYHVLRYKSVVH